MVVHRADGAYHGPLDAVNQDSRQAALLHPGFRLIRLVSRFNPAATIRHTAHEDAIIAERLGQRHDIFVAHGHSVGRHLLRHIVEPRGIIHPEELALERSISPGAAHEHSGQCHICNNVLHCSASGFVSGSVALAASSSPG